MSTWDNKAISWIIMVFYIIILITGTLKILKGDLDDYPKTYMAITTLLMGLLTFLLFKTDWKFNLKFYFILFGLIFGFLYLVYFSERLFYFDTMGNVFNSIYLSFADKYEGPDLTFSWVLKFIFLFGNF
jgi:hypothetical protein